MTLWGHALFSPCTAADCLHFANQSVAMVTHPSPFLRPKPQSQSPHPPFASFPTQLFLPSLSLSPTLISPFYMTICSV